MRANPLESLAGRSAIVTGGAGAFGSAALNVLRYLGVEAIGLDTTTGDGVLGCDLTDEGQVTRVVPEAIAGLGRRLDLLIHFAGIGPAVDVGTMPGPSVREALEVNLLGAWRVTAAALPALLREDGDGGGDGDVDGAGREHGRGLRHERGRVVITASLLAGVTLPFSSAYTVSKRALTAYADTLRVEYGSHIGVTTVYPGYVDTPIHDRSRALGVSLDGSVPAERTRDTVMTVIRAAAAPRAPRELASTPGGTAVLRLARHAPALLDRMVAARLDRLLHTGHIAGADLAYGIHERHGALGPGT